MTIMAPKKDLRVAQVNGQTRFEKVTGVKTPLDFLELPKEKRDEVYRYYLVKVRDIYIESSEDSETDTDSDDEPQVDEGALLLRTSFMGDDEVGMRLIEEAYEIYYGENTFRVRHPSFSDFLYIDTHRDFKGEISNMLRRVVLEVCTDYAMVLTPAEEDETYEGESDMRIELMTLTHIRQADSVVMEVLGDGMLDGSDGKTQTTLLQIADPVKDIIEHFGDRFTIKRVHLPTRLSINIRHYWNQPSPEAIHRVRSGFAPFEDLMQVQIQNLTER